MSRVSESPGASGGEILLFGVRVKADPMRKSLSMNNLSEYLPVVSANDNDEEFHKSTAEEGAAAASGYVSANDAAPHPGDGSRERKRGVPWTEEEHKLFLCGLQKVGKGNWRVISRDYVKTRTPTQVASHAQKHFLRQSNHNRRRRRSSVFDITTDSFAAMAMEQARNQQPNPIERVPPPPSPPLPPISGVSIAPFPATMGPVIYPVQESSALALGHTGQPNNPFRPVRVLPMPMPMPTSSWLKPGSADFSLVS